MSKDINDCRASNLISSGVIRLALHLLKRGDQVLQKHCGLTHAQLQVLFLVECHQSATQTWLAEKLDLTQAAVSRLSETLVKKGYVARQEDPKNRRANQLTLTKTGQDILEIAYSHIKKLEFELYKNIQPQELAQWVQFTDDLVKKLTLTSSWPPTKS